MPTTHRVFPMVAEGLRWLREITGELRHGVRLAMPPRFSRHGPALAPDSLSRMSRRRKPPYWLRAVGGGVLPALRLPNIGSQPLRAFSLRRIMPLSLPPLHPARKMGLKCRSRTGCSTRQPAPSEPMASEPARLQETQRRVAWDQALVPYRFLGCQWRCPLLTSQPVRQFASNQSPRPG